MIRLNWIISLDDDGGGGGAKVGFLVTNGRLVVLKGGFWDPDEAQSQFPQFPVMWTPLESILSQKKVKFRLYLNNSLAG